MEFSNIFFSVLKLNKSKCFVGYNIIYSYVSMKKIILHDKTKENNV